MMEHSRGEVSRLLGRLRAGERGALDELFPVVYEELRRLAHRHRRRWRGDETLNTTALIHELYLKLTDVERQDWQNRAHFLHAASRAMRHILINYAERRRAEKRGGAQTVVPLEDVAPVLGDGAFTPERAHALIELDRALERLSGVSDRQARIVECRVFGGMTIDETAQALDISPATVSRGWAVAQAWLHRELVGAGGRE